LKEATGAGHSGQWACDVQDEKRGQALDLEVEYYKRWVSEGLASDFRNRMALSGGKLTRGVFGKCYLLAIEHDDCRPQLPEQAANDDEFEQEVCLLRSSCRQ